MTSAPEPLRSPYRISEARRAELRAIALAMSGRHPDARHERHEEVSVTRPPAPAPNPR
jgi:hypothetical protein